MRNSMIAVLAAAGATVALPAAAQTTLYSNNFNSETFAPGVSVIYTSNGVTNDNANNNGNDKGGFAGNYIRNGSIASTVNGSNIGNLTTFQINGLTGYTGIQVAFTLAFLDTWDSTNGSPGATPDYFDIFVNNVQVLQLTSANSSGSVNNFGGGTQTAFGNLLYVNGTNDRIVDMSTAPLLQNLAPVNGTLTIGLRASGAGYQGGTDESWGIDNLVVTGRLAPPTPAVPEPATWAMMMLGFGGVGFAMRRRRSSETRIRFA